MEEKRSTDLKWLTLVRHDKGLSPLEKLVLMEVESLSHEFGYCYASNQYIADLFDVKKTWISTCISKLSKLKYISSEVNKSNNNRKIFIQGLEPLCYNQTVLCNNERLFDINQSALPLEHNSLSVKVEDNTITKIKETNNINTTTLSASKSSSSKNNNNSFSNLTKLEYIEKYLKEFGLDDYNYEKAKQYCLDKMKWNSTSFIKRCVEERWYFSSKSYDSNKSIDSAPKDGAISKVMSGEELEAYRRAIKSGEIKGY